MHTISSWSHRAMRDMRFLGGYQLAFEGARSGLCRRCMSNLHVQACTSPRS